MRRIVLRLLLLVSVPLFFVTPTPADASKQLPGSCDVLKNTHCHCMGPGLRDCLIIP